MSRYTGYFIVVDQALSEKTRFQNRTGGKRQPGSKNLQLCHPERAEISACSGMMCGLAPAPFFPRKRLRRANGGCGSLRAAHAGRIFHLGVCQPIVVVDPIGLVPSYVAITHARVATLHFEPH